MATAMQDRFDKFVDRSGEHHIWLGATRPDVGTGRFKVNGKPLPAHQVAWALAHGALRDGERIEPCPEVPACVRVDHLQSNVATPTTRPRSRRGSGSIRDLGDGLWELAVPAGNYEDGSRRREYRRVQAQNRREATAHLGAFAAEVGEQGSTRKKADRSITFDDAVEQFLTEHLAGELGREAKTVSDYRRLHAKWFAPHYGRRRLSEVDRAAIDAGFGRMVRAGLSRSRLNHARSLYAPLFRWARHRQLVLRNPMTDFRLPTSKQVSRERTVPEAEQISILLNTAIEIVPEIAPILTTGAVTGMRRGELVGLRRNRIRWDHSEICVDTAVDAGRRLKGTKTRVERTFSLDDESLRMLRRHCEVMNERAALCGITVADDAFVFSLVPDCSKPIPPDYMTKRVAVLKDHLGIADKRPETIDLEDRALELWEAPPVPRPPGRTGPTPAGAMSYREIGERLERTEMWAKRAVASARRRRDAAERGLGLSFDGSIIALRKFTSSELLDAGFNVSMVAARQGHGPQVLVKHYAKSRRSADRRAAAHLGSVVHATKPREA
jgi:integrase